MFNKVKTIKKANAVANINATERDRVLTGDPTDK